ncbi:MAG: c-type cytochrome [Bryobacterales bacterium]|nr:c-type cytochrome [Bryobacterales bacterium]
MKRTELLLPLATLLCAFSILSCAGSSPAEKAAAPPADPGQTVASAQTPAVAPPEPAPVVHAAEGAKPAQGAKGAKGDAAKGKAVFEQCAICHNVDSDEDKMGPSLKGLFHKQKMKNGHAVNEETVRAIIKAGGNGMPGYEDLLSAEEMDNLIAYLKTI